MVCFHFLIAAKTSGLLCYDFICKLLMFLLNKHIKAETHFVGRDVSAFPVHFGKFKDRSFFKNC